MRIGVPRERKKLETRVGITPFGVRALKARGASLLIEKDAGVASGFTNDEYVAAGATLASGLQQVWESDLVVKVKEPHEDEYPYFAPGKAIFSFLHLAGLPDVANRLLAGGVTGIAYEMIRGENGSLPLLEPMSEVAGKLSVINGSQYLLAQYGGKGLLLSTAGKAPAGKVVIFGAGVAGRAALHHAAGLGAQVAVFDVSEKALARAKGELATHFHPQVQFAVPTAALVEEAIHSADLIVLAVLVAGDRAPTILTRDAIKKIPRGSVIVDISIDQGGAIQDAVTTSLADPVSPLGDVLYYGVPNMPAQAPKTSTLALTSAVLPYLEKIVEHGLQRSLQELTAIRDAVMTYKGHCTTEVCAKALHIPFVPFEKV